MSDIQPGLEDDARLRAWLRSVGVAALVAAALGSIFVAAPAAPEVPSTDSTCRINVVGDQWTGRGCGDAGSSAAR